MPISVGILGLLLSQAAVAQAAQGPGWGLKLTQGVPQLPVDEFQDFLGEHEFVFVEFVGDNCPNCKMVEPLVKEFVGSMAKTHPKVPVVQTDISRDMTLRKLHKIQVLPAFHLFVNGHTMLFRGNLDAKVLTEWVTKKVGRKPTQLTKMTELRRLAKSKWSVLLALEEDNPQSLKDLTSLAALYDDLPFYYTLLPEVQSWVDSPEPNHLIIFRDMDDNKLVMADKQPFTYDTIQGFIETAKYSVVVEFSEDTAQGLFSKGLPLVMLFLDGQDEFAAREFKSVASKNQDKFSFTRVSIRGGIGERISQHFGISPKHSGTVLLVVASGTQWDKYRLDGSLTAKSLETFLESYREGKLSKFYKSEPLPPRSSDRFKKAVGTSVYELVLKPGKDVLLMITADECQQCQDLEKEVAKLAVQLRNVKNLVFVHMNSNRNEHPKIKTDKFPALKLYKSHDKESPIDMEGKLGFHDIHTFLQRNLDVDLILDTAEDDLEIEDEL